LISVTIGGLIVGVIWYWLQKKAKPVVGIGRALKGEEMPPFATAVHVVTQIFYVSTGGSIGRELAPREAGAMISQQWAKIVARLGLQPLSDDDKRLLVAAAAGAGFAGIYIAPITGMLFASEILLKDNSKRVIAVSLGMSSISMLVGMTIKGVHPYYLFPDVHFTLLMLPFAILMGPISAIVGSYFRKSFQWAEKTRTTGARQLWQLPLIGLLTGIVAAFFPQVMGNGRGLAQFAFNATDDKLVAFLIMGLILKAVVTVLTIKAGAFGGTLTPSIAVGSALGGTLGFAYLLVFPSASVMQAAMIGAVALLATSQQAPLMAMFMLFEVSHLDYSAFLPLGVAVSLAMLTSKFFLKNK
jgi:H+/Cl- antiporter ClcA